MFKASIMNIKGKSGMHECVVIPIELNHLIKGEKGVYLNLIGFELANKREGSKDTHLVKQSFPKEVREAMSEEQLKTMPIFGNHVLWSESAQEPISSVEVITEDDDLPF